MVFRIKAHYLDLGPVRQSRLVELPEAGLIDPKKPHDTLFRSNFEALHLHALRLLMKSPSSIG